MNNCVERKQLKSFVKQLKRGISSYYLQESGSEFRLVNIGDVREGKINVETVKIARIKETDAVQKSKLQLGDVIITTKGVFRAAIVDEECKGFVISSNLIAFSLRSEIPPELIVAYLNSPEGQRQLNSMAAGVAQRALNTKSFMDIYIPVPTVEKQMLLLDYLILARQYETFVKHECELREKIKNSIIESYMR